jgi:hypothetical protein
MSSGGFGNPRHSLLTKFRLDLFLLLCCGRPAPGKRRTRTSADQQIHMYGNPAYQALGKDAVYD